MRYYLVMVHEAEEGGYWAEIVDIPGYCTQGDTMEELTKNLRELIDGYEAERKTA